MVDVAHVSGDAARPEEYLAVLDEGTTDAGADGDRQDGAVGLTGAKRGLAQAVRVHVR